jgi:LytR cell envelope-related transcriptional attenuator
VTDGPPTAATPPGGAEDPTLEASAAVARPGSHRATRSRYAVVGPVLVVAVAVFAVGVGIYGWLTAADAPQALPPVIPAVSTPTPTPTPTPSDTVTPSPTPTPSASKTPKPTPTPSKTTTPVSRTTPVVVLNQTSITGLAATTGAMLERKGWQVVGVGNWRGDVSETTIYYPVGRQAQAEQLAKDLGADRVRPRASGMRTDRLTVILNSRPS